MGRPRDEDLGRYVGRDTFGDPIYEHDPDVEVGRDTFNEPVTAQDRYQQEERARQARDGWRPYQNE